MPFLSWFASWSPWQRSAGAWIFYTIWVFFLALFGIFSPWLIAPVLVCAAGLTLSSLMQLWRKQERWPLGAIAIALALAAGLALTSAPTVFGGRDQGAIAEAAWRLAERGTVAFHTRVSDTFFAVYGPGQALNFPGFFYTADGALATQFPLGYTSWLASFIALFGFAGFTVANLILFVLALWTLFELLCLFVSPRAAWAGTVVYGLSFLPLWITHFSLSENLAVWLFLSLALALLRLTERVTPADFTLVLIAAGLFPFVRIEGFAFLAITGVWCFSVRSIRQYMLERPLMYLLLPVSGWLFVFIRSFVVNFPFYTAIAKAVLKHWHEFQSVSAGAGAPASNLAAVFLPYGLLSVFVLGSLGILYLCYRRRYRPLALLLLAAPTLFYFIDPSISSDHPWMLRRYVMSLYPVFFSLAWILLVLLYESTRRTERFAARLLTSGLMLSLLPASWTLLSAPRDSQLLAETRRISEQFGERDLILVDRLASGDPFSLLSGPLSYLFGRSAVYFFNPEDLGRIETAPYAAVYLLAPAADSQRYGSIWGDRLSPVSTHTLTHVMFQGGSSALTLPRAEAITTTLMVYRISP